MPDPAPVTIATFPSKRFIAPPRYEKDFLFFALDARSAERRCRLCIALNSEQGNFDEARDALQFGVVKEESAFRLWPISLRPEKPE